MRLLLDSNAYSQLKRGHRPVAELVRKSEEVFFSAIVAGELLYGFRHGSRFERNLQELNALLDNPYVTFVPVGMSTSNRYSRVAAQLPQKGRPIPTNDIWISTHTMETGADLVSFDEHFDNIDGLAWIHLSAE